MTARVRSALRAGVLAGSLGGCPGPDPAPADADGSTSAATTSTTGTSSGPSTDATTSTTTADPSSGDGSSSSTTGPNDALCDRIGLSLVIDREAPVYAATRRAALVAFLDAIVHQTGAELIVYPNAGTAAQPPFACELDPAWASQRAFVWGDQFSIAPEAHDRFDCVLAGIQAVDATTDDDGDYMFTGLMFPVLDDDGWPAPDVDVQLAVLIAEYDDDEGGMYPRPGMASEAWLRLGRGDPSTRMLALTLGREADELATFAVSIGEDSLAYDWDVDGLQPALEAGQDAVVAACALDEPPAPAPADCTKLDVLVVVDGSASMNQERTAVAEEGFEAFASALETMGAADVRVGVISAQPGDVLLHTHRDLPAVPPTDETACGLDPNTPWIEGPSATWHTEFACLAATQASETVETTALNAALALDSRTNPGFVRPDSLVVVLMVTDEDTQSSAVTRMEIRQRVLDAVGGDLSRVFVAGVLGDQGVFELPKTTCTGPYGSASPGRRLTSIIRSFRERGTTQDICQDGMDTAFAGIGERLAAVCG